MSDAREAKLRTLTKLGSTPGERSAARLALLRHLRTQLDVAIDAELKGEGAADGSDGVPFRLVDPETEPAPPPAPPPSTPRAAPPHTPPGRPAGFWIAARQTAPCPLCGRFDPHYGLAWVAPSHNLAGPCSDCSPYTPPPPGIKFVGPRSGR